MQRSSTYSPYCSAHRKALRRHGSVRQQSITLHLLKPHIDAVEGWQRRNADSPAWAILAGRWEALTDNARGILAGRNAGRPFNKHEARAAELLLQVSSAAKPEEVTTRALALFMMRGVEPTRFPDDRGFLFTLVRQVRKLAPLAVGHYRNHKTQRVAKVYRDPPPEVTVVLGRWLVRCFAGPGCQLADMERQRAQQRAQEGRQLGEVLETMQ